jgi:hypothetical protein
MPSGDHQIVPDSPDTFYFDSTGQDRLAGGESNPQVTPVMCATILDELIEELDRRIGQDGKLDNRLEFLSAKADISEENNPPHLQFAFAVPRKSITPENIAVILDGTDISDSIKYSMTSRESRNIDIFLGSYKPGDYMEPNIQHSCSISITPTTGNSFYREMQFKVTPPEDFRIEHAGFMPDDKAGGVYFDKLLVFINARETGETSQKLIDAEKWILTNKSDKPLPTISSITRKERGIYEIQLTDDLKSLSKFDILLDLGNGIVTNNYEILAPARGPERGGGVYREAAVDYPPCPPGCTGTLTRVPGPVEIPDCRNSHTWTVTAICPDFETCYSQIWETGSRTTYDFSRCSYINDETSATGVRTDTDPLPLEGNECGSITGSETSENDITKNYVMMGYTKVQGESVTCGPISDPVTIVKMSDTHPPVIGDAMFLEHDTTPQSCSNNCCKELTYRLTFDATDDICLNDRNTQLILFYNDGSNASTTPRVVAGTVSEDGKYMKQTFEFDDADTFACVTSLKIIVHDKKGNWGSKVIEQQDTMATVRNAYQLPYPNRLEISLGERNTYQDGYKQFVNLERHYTKDFTTCAYKPDYENHGEYIHIEVKTIPPIYGVSVKLEWLDPRSNALEGNQPPTNRIGTVYGSNESNPPVYDSYTPPFNLLFTPEDNELLWSDHPAWGVDGRSLGDNYNFFGNPADCGGPDAPDCDPNDISSWPIRSNQPVILPCFLKPDCDPNNLLYCVDIYCDDFGFTGLNTNILGKAAILFDTQSFGGDNFQFKASTINGERGFENCLQSSITETIQVWRKIIVDYSWMEKRDDYYCDGRKKWEYENVHKINSDNDFLPFFQGVFDDCYIKIEHTRTISDTDYITSFSYLQLYDQTHVGWNNYPGPYPHVPLDTVLIMGIDHFQPGEFNPCPNTLLGVNSCPSDEDSQQWYNAVLVGNIFDKIEKEDMVLVVDFRETQIEDFIGLQAGAHEITHCIAYDSGNGGHVNTYGLMYYDGINPQANRKRTYHNHNQIIQLRRSLPKFDQNDL